MNRGVGPSDFGGGHKGGHPDSRRDEYSRESGDSIKHREEREEGVRRGDSGRDRGDAARRGHHEGGRDRRRSRSREDNRRRSRDKDEKRRSRDRDERRRSKSRERRRSRSRSRDRRDADDRAGGWRSWNEKGGRGRGGRDRDRRGGGGYEERQRRREEREQEREEQVKKAEEMGVEIPKYFKPGGVQPVSYAEQVVKANNFNKCYLGIQLYKGGSYFDTILV